LIQINIFEDYYSLSVGAIFKILIVFNLSLMSSHQVPVNTHTLLLTALVREIKLGRSVGLGYSHYFDLVGG
jgi:hypothetical protein